MIRCNLHNITVVKQICPAVSRMSNMSNIIKYNCHYNRGAHSF